MSLGTSTLSSEPYDIHTEPLQQSSPVEQLASLSGVPLSIKEVITSERRKHAREGAESLVTILTHKEQLERSKIDGITGLRNAVAFSEEYPRLFGRAKPGEMTVQYIDLNGLKRVNDESHAKGDQYLADTASAIQSSLRPTDFLYRVGGDELVAILEGPMTAEESVAIQKRIHEHVMPAIEGLDISNQLHLGISSGAAIMELGDTPESLIERADQACIQSKESFYADIESTTGLDLRR